MVAKACSLSNPCDIITSVTMDDDCPLCLEAMSLADRLYPLRCPTVACRFLFCGECLQKLFQSAADGYSLASDGSHQVKVALQCPQCRGPYNTQNSNNRTVSSPNNSLKPASLSSSSSFSSSSSSATATMVVAAVLKLRQAVSIPLPGTKGYLNDSECSASVLTARHEFLHTVSVKELQDAIVILQDYNDGIHDDKHCDSDTMTVPSLDWEVWREFLEQCKASSSPRNSRSFGGESSNAEEQRDSVLPRDPTLFMGLEDLLSVDEQEFITSMLVSGRAETIAQAAHLLQSIVEIMTSNRNSIVDTNGGVVQRKQHRPVAIPTVAHREHQQKIRKRFPIPAHMPRAVVLPSYNPLDLPKALLKFAAAGKTPKTRNVGSVSTILPPNENNSSDGIDAATIAPSELTVASVRGAAGPVGLRKGDVVTHVMGESVATWSEFTIAMQHQLLLHERSTNNSQATCLVQVTVNANDDTARQLQERARDMKQQGIRFHV